MSDDRVKEYYHGFELIAQRGSPQAEGRGWHMLTGKKLSSVGSTVVEVIATLRKQADLDVANNLVEYQRILSSKHREVLAARGKPDMGRGRILPWDRASQCHSCKKPVSNVFDLECLACHWIVCTYCGSCGCNIGPPPGPYDAILSGRNA